MSEPLKDVEVGTDITKKTVTGNTSDDKKCEKDGDNKEVDNEAHARNPTDAVEKSKDLQEDSATNTTEKNSESEQLLKKKALQEDTNVINTAAETKSSEPKFDCADITESDDAILTAVEATEKFLDEQKDNVIGSENDKEEIASKVEKTQAADEACTLKAEEAVTAKIDEKECAEKLPDVNLEEEKDDKVVIKDITAVVAEKDLKENSELVSDNLPTLNEIKKASTSDDKKNITVEDTEVIDLDTSVEEVALESETCETTTKVDSKEINEDFKSVEGSSGLKGVANENELKKNVIQSTESDEKNILEKDTETNKKNTIDKKENDFPEVAKIAEVDAEKIEKISDDAAIKDEDNESKTELSLASKQHSDQNEVVVKSGDKSKVNEENIANKSTTDILEHADKKAESLADDKSSDTLTNDASDSQDSKKTLIDEKEKNNTTIEDFKEKSTDVEFEENTCKTSTAEEQPTKETDKTSESMKETSEVIEIDDDDEEMQKSSKLKDDAPKGETIDTDSIKEDQKEDSTKTPNINEENDSNDTACAKMHTVPIIFYNKECINFECPKNDKDFHRAPEFAMNYFKVVKKKVKIQYICGECYDTALNFYEDLCGMLNSKQPILLRDITSKKQEFVEILDSSDEEDNSTNETDSKEKDNTSFSKNDLTLIETELENSIRGIFNRVEIQNQLTWSKTIFTERVQKLQDELEYIDAELNEQQKMADKMYNNLYDSGKYRINVLKPLDLDNESFDQIPSYGEIERPPIRLGELYYAAKHKAIASWLPCRAVEQVESTHIGLQKSVPNYRVKFISSQYQTFKNLSSKLIAYYDPPTVRLIVGQRVIAYFDGTTLSPRDKDKSIVQSAFYPGIIAEEMKPNNFFRYLIFYDDGYTQYVSHKDVRLVCHVARNVWEDVDQSSREFIQKYIMEYRVNRPMVQTHKGQKMATESNGRWVPARVIDIDCSLVRMQFDGTTKNHKEWIYRGSLRLNPVYMEYQKSKNSQASQMPVSRLPRRTEPFIRYTEDEENIRGSLGTQQRNSNRSDAAAAAPKVRHLNANTIYLEDENKPKGKVIYYTAKRQLPTKTFKPHKCGPHCLIVVPHNLNGYSPLAKPLLSGWERIFFRQKVKKRVFYRAPCGKSFRDMKEVHQYLRLTKNTLNVDSFDFYPETSCLAEFEAENVNLRKRDISNGQEKMPLPLVNYFDETLPECTYSAKVIPTEGVHINTNPDFLICCDCEDDCVDKEKCACWNLTIEGVRSINPDAQIDEIGYQYKRLYDHLPTGIYECNSRCKCKSHCINRVVQHSLEMKLQVFKTTNRGWGLRSLNDVPRGSFVCIYAGNLLTEAKANEGGLDAGDEYFAELDYIETVEQLKEGYESDVEMQEDEDDEEPYLPDDDDDFRPGKSFLSRSKRSQRQLSNEGERQAINFNPRVAMEDDSKKKRLSVRQFFGKDEAVYVMDAKVTGNLGRYFNHSCSPNLFVQNVFVDTHDVRFPWVAFFSLTHIRAGTELTWNYNYEVGVVPGKVLYCQCGAPNCRQRLL